MKIRDMFYRGIDREINGVIKVGQKDKENVFHLEDGSLRPLTSPDSL